MKFHFYIAPHFINRYYLDRDIKYAVTHAQMHGRVLDIGCGDKPYQKYFTHADRYIGVDFRQYSHTKGYAQAGKPDVYFPPNYTATFRLPFADNSFDHAVSFQVIEHHPEPDTLISEIARVVKPGGQIIISAPFIWSIHEAPHDYFRFTHFALVQMLNNHGCTVEHVLRQGSVCSLIITIITDYCIWLASKNRLLRLVAYAAYPVLLIMAYICLILDQLFCSDTLFLNYVVSASKSYGKKTQS